MQHWIWRLDLLVGEIENFTESKIEACQMSIPPILTFLPKCGEEDVLEKALEGSDMYWRGVLWWWRGMELEQKDALGWKPFKEMKGELWFDTRRSILLYFFPSKYRLKLPRLACSPLQSPNPNAPDYISYTYFAVSARPHNFLLESATKLQYIFNPIYLIWPWPNQSCSLFAQRAKYYEAAIWLTVFAKKIKN
jgi:hypothetical protein